MAFFGVLMVILLAVIVSAAVSRSSAAKLRRSEVHGVILRSGQPIPLAECRVTFINAEQGLFVPVTLASDGSYRVRNHLNCKLPPGVCDECGLPPGIYQVVISFPAEFLPPTASRSEALPAADLEAQLARFIPQKYRDPETSGLTISLTGEDAVFDVDMQK